MKTATIFEIPGHTIIECLGLVRGITVRVPSTGQSWSAAFKSLGGGRSQALSDLCEATRKEAFDHMLSEAEKIGANAIVGVRYDASPVIDLASEVICYGTAVVIQRS